MKFTANYTDEANATVVATIDSQTLANSLNDIAKQASKTMEVQGFRKGKVPVSIIKERYKDKMEQDTQNNVLQKLYSQAQAKLKINSTDLIGEPVVSKFDKQENNDIKVELKINLRPKVDLGDYKKLLPEVKSINVTAKEIDDQIKTIAVQDIPLEKIKRKRAVKSGDFVIIDFEGFKDGVAFDGGKGSNHTLEIGSNSFIPGFEEQIIGMKYDEIKDIKVTFPKEYKSKDLAGIEAVFKITLHEIQEKSNPTIDDEFAKKVLPQEKNATVELLKSKIKDQIKHEKTAKYYNNKLKPQYLDNLVKSLTFAIPQSILEQEINQILNSQIRTMDKDKIEKLKENTKQIDKMKEDAIPDATSSVKATFIIDALAKAESIEVTDQEVSQTVYYEAMMQGQDGVGALKKYEEMGYLPAIKMSILEQKVITKLLNDKSQGKK
ncbi:Cell division trigger factor [hydrothermal vent metagenome]|uniref:peptidylprolyl isomerase n=1 Tax=hydrothermal vent metagenome TaxID=652676 RepID=A0A3B1E737_9ZZZZ